MLTVTPLGRHSCSCCFELRLKKECRICGGDMERPAVMISGSQGPEDLEGVVYTLGVCPCCHGQLPDTDPEALANVWRRWLRFAVRKKRRPKRQLVCRTCGKPATCFGPTGLCCDACSK